MLLVTFSTYPINIPSLFYKKSMNYRTDVVDTMIWNGAKIQKKSPANSYSMVNSVFLLIFFWNFSETVILENFR